MERHLLWILLLHFAGANTGADTGNSTVVYTDTRDIRNGRVMLKTGYTDQPYCATPGNGTWSCVITASFGGEGSTGEAVYSVVSEDMGRTWTAPIVVEPGTSHPGGLPNAYANIVYAPELGRLYTVYNYNRDNVTMPGRVDELGFFYMRFSEDHGYHWSESRYHVPYPDTWIDRQNDFGGKHHIMWTVDHIKPFGVHGAIFAFTKIGKYVQNPPEEIFFMHSPNLLSEQNVSKVIWELLPRGDHGIRAPSVYGWNSTTTVMEEGHVLPLAPSARDEALGAADAGLYVMARTDKGFIAAASTKDPTAQAGWSAAGVARYWDPRKQVGNITPLEDLPQYGYQTGLKNERGPFTPKRQPNGMYLLIFYNCKSNHRDPYFLSAGLQHEEIILWSQPEIVLFDRLVRTGTSAGGYPDFVNGIDGGTYLTVAQKQAVPNSSTAYVSRIDDAMLHALFSQHVECGTPNSDRLALNFSANDAGTVKRLPPGFRWPALDVVSEAQQGFSFVLRLSAGAATKGSAVPLSLLSSDSGVMLSLGANASGITLALQATNATNEGAGAFVTSLIKMDPACSAMLTDHTSVHEHMVAVVLDAGARLVTFFVDGILCDGGGQSLTGWWWTTFGMGRITGGQNVTISSGIQTAAVSEGLIYSRTLYTSELVAYYRATTAKKNYDRIRS